MTGKQWEVDGVLDSMNRRGKVTVNVRGPRVTLGVFDGGHVAPRGEMADMTAGQTGELIQALREALDELLRRDR